MSNQRIAIDFDGVLHNYTSPWNGADDIPDGVVPGALDAVNKYVEAGYTVVVFSCRARDAAGRAAIVQWLANQGFPFSAMRVQAEKPAAMIYIDDRGYHFMGTFPTLQEIAHRRQWNKKDET